VTNILETSVNALV